MRAHVNYRSVFVVLYTTYYVDKTKLELVSDVITKELGYDIYHLTAGCMGAHVVLSKHVSPSFEEFCESTVEKLC
jgi:hypothetical protein